jgi:hypothetical protein
VLEYTNMNNDTVALFFINEDVPSPFLTPTEENPFLDFVRVLDNDVSNIAGMDQAAAQWRDLFPDATMKETLMFMAGVLAMYYWTEWRCSADPYGIMLSTLEVMDAAEEDATRLCSQAWEVIRRNVEG